MPSAAALNCDIAVCFFVKSNLSRLAVPRGVDGAEHGGAPAAAPRPGGQHPAGEPPAARPRNRKQRAQVGPRGAPEHAGTHHVQVRTLFFSLSASFVFVLFCFAHKTRRSTGIGFF